MQQSTSVQQVLGNILKTREYAVYRMQLACYQYYLNYETIDKEHQHMPW